MLYHKQKILEMYMLLTPSGEVSVEVKKGPSVEDGVSCPPSSTPGLSWSSLQMTFSVTWETTEEPDFPSRARVSESPSYEQRQQRFNSHPQSMVSVQVPCGGGGGGRAAFSFIFASKRRFTFTSPLLWEGFMGGKTQKYTHSDGEKERQREKGRSTEPGRGKTEEM